MEQNSNTGLDVLTDVVPAGTTIQLPNHFDEKGDPVKLQINSDISAKDLQQQIDIKYPNDVNALARQMVFGSPDKASRVTQEQFNDVLDAASIKEQIDKDRGVKSNNAGFFSLAGNTISHVVGSIADGLTEVAKQGVAGADLALKGKYSEALKANAYGVVKLIEGVAEGTEQFSQATKLLGHAAFLQDTNVNKYAMYNIAKDMELTDQQRKAGDTLLFGQNPEIGASAALSKNVLDLSLVLPALGKLVGGLGKAGVEVAVQSVKALAEQTGVGFARKVAGNAVAASGEAIANAANAAQVLTSSLKKGIGVGGQVAVGVGAIHAAEEHPYLAGGLALLAVGAPAVGSIVGKGMQFAGKAMASDSAILAGREILEQGSRNAAEDFAVRTALRLTPPDSVVRTLGSIFDASVHGAVIGSGLSYGQAMSDPFASAGDVAQNTILGGLGGAAASVTLSGIMHTALRPEFSKGARDLNYARNIATDIQSRPEQRSVIIDGQEVSSNDKANRINTLVRSDISTGDKARINSILRSAEAAGHDVVFVDDATKLPDSLGTTGAGMGKGVTVVSDAGTGRSTILINSDKITAASAIEEVSHAVISDQMATDVLGSLIKEGGGIRGAIDKLTPFAERYISTQRETNPAAADALQAKFDIAKQPAGSENDRLAALLPIVHEYAAMGSSEMLKGRPPELLETGSSRNVWIKAAHNVQSGLGMLPSGATKDPITGFFWKDGKITDDKVLQGVSKSVSKFIDTGKAPVSRTQAPMAEPAAPKTGYQAGDIAPDGSRVVAEVPHVRYEDKVVDSKTGQLRQSKKSEQDNIHGDIFNLTSRVLGTENIDPQRYEQGIYGGNVSVGNGSKPIVFKDTPLSSAELLGLFSIRDHLGNLIIKPENQQHIELLNASIGTGNIVNLDSVVNLNRSTSNRDYATRVNGKALILGLQQTPKGGMHVLTYDLSLLDNLINHERGLTPVIDKALKEYKINSLDDAVPYIKTYLENLSQSKALPSEFKLALAAPEGASATSARVLRDVFHLAGGLTQRKNVSTDALLNIPFKQRLGAPVEAGRTRDQSVFNNRRIDDILGASLYQPEGIPVSIKVDKSKMVSRYRANFSPSTSPTEKLGDSKVITDPIAKERIIVSPNGKASLFKEDGRKITFASEQDAIESSNKQLAKSRIQFSPDTEGYQRYTPEEKKKLQQHILYSDVRDGTAFKELWAAHDSMLRGRQETEGGDLPTWVQAKEIRTDIERKSESLMRSRRRMAETIRKDSEAWQAEDKPPVYDPELIEPSKGRKARSERRQMSAAELEAVTEASGYKPPVGKPAETPPTKAVKPGTTLKSLQDLTGLQTYAPSPKAEPVVVQQAAPTARPNVVDLISQRRVPFRVIPIKTEIMTGFLKELSGSKGALYEQALQKQASSEVGTYTEPRKAATPPPHPPKQTAAEGLVSAMDDPAIPSTHIIQPMPSGKFKVWSIGRQAVDAITESYEDAVKKAQAKKQADLKKKPTPIYRRNAA